MIRNLMVEDVDYLPRAERVSFDMLVRYRHAGRRSTVVLRNLTAGGARIDGLEDLRWGDEITLMLPSLKPKEARVAWVSGHSAGLEFERPLHPDIFESLVLHHGQWRERSDTDRMQPAIAQERPPFDFVPRAA